jgi:hypothetical protein
LIGLFEVMFASTVFFLPVSQNGWGTDGAGTPIIHREADGGAHPTTLRPGTRC